MLTSVCCFVVLMFRLCLLVRLCFGGQWVWFGICCFVVLVICVLFDFGVIRNYVFGIWTFLCLEVVSVDGRVGYLVCF